MSDRLVHLHAHGTYSMLDGYGRPEQIVERLKTIGQDACALTDHGNCYGHVPFYKATRDTGIKPIFGCEFYYREDISQRSKMIKGLGVEAFPHITILARDQGGYENFLQLIGDASSKGYYYKPSIDLPLLFARQKGLQVLTGCPTGMPSRLIAEGQIDDAKRFIRRIRDNCDHAAVEIVGQPGYGPAEKAGSILIDIANELGMQYVFTGDCHFPSPEDHTVQNLMVHIALKVPYGQPKAVNLPAYQYYCTRAELKKRIEDMSATGYDSYASRHITDAEIERGLDATLDIAGQCNVEILQGKSVSYPDRGEKPDKVALWEAIEDGFKFRLEQGTLPVDKLQEYRQRAEREYNVIAGKGFSDYLLAIADIGRWAKSQNSLVMCRGSAGGCLLLWLIGASETDPIFHDLSFERFYDENRPDAPDVDMDFETTMREPVIKYITDKYGQDHCAQLLALSLMRAKVAVVDTAEAFGIPRKEYEILTMAIDSKDDELGDQLDNFNDPAIRAVIEKHPELRIAEKLVKQVRQSTIHACGIVVSADPLYKSIATLQQPGKPAVCSIDKHAASDMGYLKFDLLSVAGYDVVGNAMRKIGLPVSDLYKMRFDDPKVFETARSGKVVGVFQLDGAAIQVGREIGLDLFIELYAASALCRPGASQFVGLYKRNKQSGEVFEKFLAQMDPRCAAIVRPTYGVVLYQEQMMAFARLSGYSWKDVHKLRKRVAASSFHGMTLGPEWSEPFINGCIDKGISQQEAEHWWAAIKEHGVYSFNKSHCVTYAIVTYWMLWIKTYHPEAYYEAFLSQEGNSDSPNMSLMKRLVGEFRADGGKIQLVSKDKPTVSFTSPEKGLIVGGWANIAGIGQTTAEKIVANGPYNTWRRIAQVLPTGVYGKLVAAGVTGEMLTDNGKRLAAAPWFPAGQTPEYIEAKMKPYRSSVARPGQLPIGESVYNVLVSGFVSTRFKKPRTGSFKGDQIIYSIEDETGIITARVSTQKKELIAKVDGEFQVGDYVVVKGWWTGDGTLFISDYTMMRKVHEIEAASNIK